MPRTQNNVISTPPILLIPPRLDAASLQFRLCRLSHLHLKCSQSERRQLGSDILAEPNFHPPRLKHAVKASTFITRLTCFPRRRREVFGHYLGGVGHCLDTRRLFVSSREERVSDAATSDDRSHNSLNSVARRRKHLSRLARPDFRRVRCELFGEGERSEPEPNHLPPLPVTRRRRYRRHSRHPTVQRVYCKPQTPTSCFAMLC